MDEPVVCARQDLEAELEAISRSKNPQTQRLYAVYKDIRHFQDIAIESMAETKAKLARWREEVEKARREFRETVWAIVHGPPGSAGRPHRATDRLDVPSPERPRSDDSSPI